jgi:hypothetical protein
MIKKLAVLAAGIALGELAWVNFIGPAVVNATGSSGDSFGVDDVARYGTYAGGVLLLQSFL